MTRAPGTGGVGKSPHHAPAFFSNKINRNILLILALVFSLVLANQARMDAGNSLECHFVDSSGMVDTALPTADFIAAPGERVLLEVPGPSNVADVRISVRAAGAAPIAKLAGPGVTYVDQRKIVHNGQETIRFLCGLGPRGARLTLEAPGKEDLRIVSVDARIIRHHDAGLNLGHKAKWLSLLVLAALPVYWLLHSRPAASEWFLISLSATVVGILDIRFAVVLGVFLWALHALRKPLAGKGNGKWPALLAAILGCAFFLFLFKYFSQDFYSLFALKWAGVGIPLGISYFLFRSVHVAMDWYRGLHTGMPFRTFLCYIIFLPTIPAGPIDTVDGFSSNRLQRMTLPYATEAIERILNGLFKKIVIINFVLNGLLFQYRGSLSHALLIDPEGVSWIQLVLTLFLFLIYAYIDLSGYTDIAIGAGLLFGRRICENFNRPLLSKNIGEFWNSYHMSLGNWCKRHVYFPTLISTRNTTMAIILSMLTMGLWHHLNINWMIWGFHQAFGLIFIMLMYDVFKNKNKIKNKISKMMLTLSGTAATLFYVSGCMAIVFIQDINTAVKLYIRFFTFH